MRTATIIRRTSEGWQRRTQLDFDALMGTEKSVGLAMRMPTSFSVVYDYWRSLQRGGVVRLADFQPQRLGGLGLPISQVDIDVDNPWHYRFTSYKGIHFQWMNGKCLADFPVAPVIDECALEYFECKSGGRPVAHHIQHDLNGFSRDYLRLLLPLAGDDGSPRALVSVGRHLSIQGPGESSPAIRRGSTKP